MKWSTLLPLALPLLQLTSAWEIAWTDANNKEHTRSGHGPSDCIVIDNPKGHLFKIDAQGENGINMLLFTNKKCSGEPAGMATQEFSKDSSEDLLGFKVVSTATPTASTGTATTTATGKAGGHNSTMTATTLSSQTASSSGGGSGTTTAKTTTGTSTATATTTAETSTGATTTTSSAASATTTNAAVQLAVANGYLAKGLLGGVFGLAMMQLV